jgi:hypothetical protein
MSPASRPICCCTDRRRPRLDLADLDFADLDFAGLDFAGLDFAGLDFAGLARLMPDRLRGKTHEATPVVRDQILKTPPRDIRPRGADRIIQSASCAAPCASTGSGWNAA